MGPPLLRIGQSASLKSAPEVARATQIIDLSNQRSGEKGACNHKAREPRKAFRNGFPLRIFKHGSSQSLVKLMLAENGNFSPIPGVWRTQCHFSVNPDAFCEKNIGWVDMPSIPPQPQRGHAGHRKSTLLDLTLFYPSWHAELEPTSAGKRGAEVFRYHCHDWQTDWQAAGLCSSELYHRCWLGLLVCFCSICLFHAASWVRRQSVTSPVSGVIKRIQ